MPDAATGLTANFEEVSAAYPEGTGNTNANNYLTSVTTEGGRTNVNYSANTHPGEKVVTIGTVQIGRGESFSMNLIAYSLGAGSTSAVREDMRYCHASLFTDFDGALDDLEQSLLHALARNVTGDGAVFAFS